LILPFDTIRLDVDQRIAIVTLARPERSNTLNERMAFELREACHLVRQNDDVRVVVLTGEGDAFCRGTDFSESQRSFERLKVADAVASIEKPVIAALNGDARDQGLELALACDMRVTSSDARLGLAQVQSGLIPWDGGTQRMPRLIGRGRAMEMILASRIVDAQEALNMGLVNHLAEPGQALTKAREIASAIAGHGPIASRYLKEAVLKGADMTLDQGLRLEADLNFILQTTADRAEGLRSFLERRAPEYHGE
jgi:enoyl-CoA hydratase